MCTEQDVAFCITVMNHLLSNSCAELHLPVSANVVDIFVFSRYAFNILLLTFITKVESLVVDAFICECCYCWYDRHVCGADMSVVLSGPCS